MGEQLPLDVQPATVQLFTCDNCGKSVDCVFTNDLGKFCNDCNDDLSICERCGCLSFDVSEVQRGAGRASQYWCDDCICGYSTQCDDCGETTADEYGCRVVDSRWVCDRCQDGNYGECNGCGEVCPCDDLRGDGWGDYYYCEGCYEPEGEEEEGSSYIHEYDYKPKPIFHGGGGIIHYGVELEVNAPCYRAEDVIDVLGGENHVYLKKDSSVDGGFEIVTHPHTLDAHRELWDGLFDNDPSILDDMSAEENGMHVHIQRSYLSRLQLQKMVVFINRREHEAFVEFIADRCPRRWAAVDPTKATFNYKAYSGDRYTALNLCNERTAEIRIFRGTLDRDRIAANLQFCDALVTFCGAAGCRDLTVDAFAAHVRRYGKRYRELDRLLVSGGYLAENRKPYTGRNERVA